MKRKCMLLLVSLIWYAGLFCQVPQSFNYQAIARNPDGTPIAGTVIGVRITILEGGPEGSSVYIETHHPETNEYGLFSLQVGTGTANKKFTDIAWGNGIQKWIRVSLDPGNDGSYTVMGSSQLVSVPFALHSEQASVANPRLQKLTDQERDQISAPEEGSMILNTTSKKLNVRMDGNWYSVPLTLIAPEWSCGRPLTDERDGQSYATVQIGSLCWLAQNLNVGQKIPLSTHPSNNGIIEKYYYDDSDANGEVYGGLYTWDEMMEYSREKGSRGICPAGWHIPTDEEWKAMEMALGMSESDANRSNVWRGTDQGTQLGPVGGSGYHALYSGRSVPGFGYTARGSFEYVWSSNESADAAWRRCLDESSPQVGRFNTFPKTYGMSVRCVK